MAKDKDRQSNTGEKQAKKKSFWSNFFEPVPSDDDFDPASANRQYGEPPEPPLTHLFSDEDVEFSDEEDAADLANLTWEDGEKVVSDTERLRYSAKPRESAKPKAKKKTEENIRLFDNVEDDFYEDEEEPARTHTTRTRIFRTGASTTARIHINETEETIRMAEAEKKARAREAARKHEEYVERQLRKKQRNALATKLFGNFMFVILMLVAVGIALYYGFLLSDIVVMGNENYDANYIVERSGLKLGTHMLFVDLDKAEENIAQDPYLQVDSVTYIFPSRVRIVVTERKAVAGIVGLDSNVIIDKNGYVLSMAGGTDISDLIQVTGVTVSGFQLGQRLGQGNDFSTATLVQIISVLEQYDLAASIKSIDMTTPLAITMTAQNGLKIHVGQATELDTKMDVLARLLPQFVSKGITNGTLYLSAKGGTVYSTTSYTDRTPIETTDDANTNNDLLPVDADGDGIDDNTGLPYVPAPVDADGDGIDDNTGEPYTPAASTAPTATAEPTPSGGSDDFSG
ncbi:MAG: FtsQ-type POTRA domain-containing protein [Clostridiales bacterium]|nr:FtsQ-type POTRA domain-containing protein [Clostridiales bacterium]